MLSFLTAFLLYLSTLFGLTNHFLILMLVPLFLGGRKFFYISENEYKFLFFLLFIVSLSLINNAVGLFYSETISFPFFAFSLLPFIFKNLINDKVLLYILLFIVFEIFLAVIQYYLGVSSFFSFSERYYEFTSDALYFRKSSGLSASSSVLAYKVLVAFFIVELIAKSKNVKLIFNVVLFVGLYVTFNRTAIVASLAFILICNRNLIVSALTNKFSWLTVPGLLLLIGFIVPTLYEFMIVEFSRGDSNSGVDLSYRTVVWRHYADFINDNILLGNFSNKYISTLSVSGYGLHSFHAHNSFLMLLSSQGILISFMFIALLLTRINMSNFKFVIPIFIYSSAQYGVFWGVSFLDVFLAYFLMMGCSSFDQVRSL